MKTITQYSSSLLNTTHFRYMVNTRAKTITLVALCLINGNSLTSSLHSTIYYRLSALETSTEVIPKKVPGTIHSVWLRKTKTERVE